MCSGGVSSDWATIKDAVFSSLDLTYLPCRRHPPDIPCDEEGSLEGQVHKRLVLV